MGEKGPHDAAANGADPVEQLYTDDFLGASAHNANLALKSAVAVRAYALLCAALNDTVSHDVTSCRLDETASLGELPLLLDDLIREEDAAEDEAFARCACRVELARHGVGTLTCPTGS